MRFMVSASAARGGIGTIVGAEATFFEDISSSTEKNDFVNQLRDEIRDWRGQGYPGTALVTRRLLEWWFERDEERKAMGKRFFFCQQEAVEAVIYLYEVQSRRKLPETGNLLRYALKLATGTGKTVVMAMLVTWSTLHKRKVSGSTLSSNFLVLVPNLTVRDRVSGVPRGDGLEPGGEHNLYKEFDTVPPEYLEEFQPNIMVKNWQSIPLEAKRDDWIGEEVVEEGRFIPAAVLRAMRRRAQQDPNAVIQRVLRNWRDVFVINDEAHHAYGEKKTRKGEEPEFLKWSKILDRIAKATRVSLVADLSATPWYGSGSNKPEGSLYEWLVSDFSVYDAFESGLVKVVRLPDPDEQGRIYLDLWDLVKGAKTKEEYLRACKGAIASIYASWRGTIRIGSRPLSLPEPCPVRCCFAWLTMRRVPPGCSNISLRNTNSCAIRMMKTERNGTPSRLIRAYSMPTKAVEAALREIVSTVGKTGMAGERVRCVVSVQMLTEGWDVKSVSHILGIRAFGSPLLTEQIIGRGLRRTNYDVLNQPLDERPEGYEETVDAFGIPFIGFPVQKRKRSRTGSWENKPVWIETDAKKAKFQIRVPNVRSWAVSITKPLSQVIQVNKLATTLANPVAEVTVRPVVGGNPEAVMTLDEFRREWPLLRTSFLLAEELYEATNPGSAADLGIGPTYDELLEVTREYVQTRVTYPKNGDKRDIGIYNWRLQARDLLENAIRGASGSGTSPCPFLPLPNGLILVS